MIVFGEDVGVKGGVYGVTGGLARRFGAARVFDTVLDEQSILGLGLGAGLAGLIPIPEIQYLAYLHNAEDQLRGEAATLPFFSRPLPEPDGGPGRRTGLPEGIRRPLPQRQRGRGAARHPGTGRRLSGPGGRRRRRCCAPASPRPVADGTVSVFLEPIALYHRRDLHQAGDGGWLAADPGRSVPSAAPGSTEVAQVPAPRQMS